MRILVIGASQGTGALVVKAALARGDSVTAFARSPEKLDLLGLDKDAKLTRLKGDFHDPQSVEDAVAGHDAVVITAGLSSRKAFQSNPTFFSRGTGYVIGAMKKQGVKRLVVLSALGVAESRGAFGFLLRALLVDGLLGHVMRDHTNEDALVRASGLDWVLARPSRLTDGPAKGHFVKTTGLKKIPGSISRADVADFLVEATSSSEWVRKAVHLGG